MNICLRIPHWLENNETKRIEVRKKELMYKNPEEVIELLLYEGEKALSAKFYVQQITITNNIPENTLKIKSENYRKN